MPFRKQQHTTTGGQGGKKWEPTSIDTLFGCLHSDLALLCDSRCDFDCLVHNVALADDARDEATLFGIVGREVAASEHHLHGGRFAHGLGQPLRAASTGDHAEVDFGLAKVGRWRCKDDITPEGSAKELELG